MGTNILFGFIIQIFHNYKWDKKPLWIIFDDNYKTIYKARSERELNKKLISILGGTKRNDLLSSILGIPFQKTIRKWWREDKCLWEERKKIFWFINYYVYSIFKDGKLNKHTRLFKYSKQKYLITLIVPQWIKRNIW